MAESCKHERVEARRNSRGKPRWACMDCDREFWPAPPDYIRGEPAPQAAEPETPTTGKLDTMSPQELLSQAGKLDTRYVDSSKYGEAIRESSFAWAPKHLREKLEADDPANYLGRKPKEQPKPEPRCGDCRWSVVVDPVREPHRASYETLACTRFPPRADYCWPHVHHHQRCGEFAPKEPGR